MSNNEATVIFAGSPDFAVPSLRALVDAGYSVAGVLSQPDRRSGRGRKLSAGPVKAFALAAGFEILQPETLACKKTRARLRELNPDVMVVAAYGLLLPLAILELPVAGCINVHASLLPRWRGASPIQAAILAGDPVTGVSIMRMERGLDTGPVFARSEIEIGERETAGELEMRLADLGAGLLLKWLPDILSGTSVPEPQDDSTATHAGRIAKADALIDWRNSALSIDRQVRAYNPWPVAETIFDGMRLRCWSAHAAGDQVDGAVPGQVTGVDGEFVDVQTGDGLLRLTEVLLPGRQNISAAAFANGYSLIGEVLGE